MKKVNVFAIGVATILIGLVFYPTPGFSSSQNEIRVGLVNYPPTVNIVELKSIATVPVVGAVHEFLFGTPNYEKGGLREPLLVQHFRFLPNKKDLKLTLRKGVRFHTGDPLTAHDVKFTIDQMLDPKNSYAQAAVLSEIEDIEILDDHTLVIRFYEVYAPWRNALAGVGVTSKQYYEKVGREKFRNHPVGSGPFRFVESKTDQYILLETVKNHPEYTVAFDKLRMILATDETTRISMLQTGELDLIHNISPHNIKHLKKHGNIKVKECSMTLGFKQLSTKLSWFPEYNSKLVLAIAHAIDRKTLVEKMYLGHGYPLSLWASKVELGYDPNYEYEYDPEKAKQLLKESGYKPGSEILMTYTNIMPNVGAVASAIQKYLSNIGMNVKIQLLERGTYVTYFMKKDKRVGFMSLSGTAWPEDPHSRFMAQMHSGGFVCPYWTRHNQKEMDDLVDQQAKELNFQKRIKLIKKIRDINFKDPLSVPLFGTNIIYAMNKKIDYTWTDSASHFVGLHLIKIVE